MNATPQQVNEMTLWQFLAAWDGYQLANGASDKGKLSDKEKDDLWEWLQD